MKDLGPISKFLGLNIHQDIHGFITLTLADYMASAAATADIYFHQTTSTPLSSTTNYSDPHSPRAANITEYQSIVGQLIFVSNTGRPDIAVSVSQLVRYLKDPV